jgi:hypothetical protein
MKILAAVMDVVFIKYFKTFRVREKKRCLIYDPRKVAPRDFGKKVKDD